MIKARNFKLFYLHELFFRFSDDMLLLVLPIFIYKIYGSISAIFFFVMIWNIIHGLLFIPMFNLAMRLGRPKYFMIIGMVFYISALLIFSRVTPESKELMIPGTILFSLYIAFYWMVRHWFTANNVDGKQVGKQMSIISLIRTFVSFTAPIVAGTMAHFVSFNATFVLGLTSATISLIPIALFNAPPHPEKYSLKKVIATMKLPEVRAVSPGYFWEGVSFATSMFIWPLIFFIFVGTILNLGFLIGGTTLITGVLIWMTGQKFDRKNRPLLLTQLTNFRATSILLYASVYFWPHMIYVWLVEFSNRLALSTQYTVMDSYLYSYGSRTNPVNFAMVREMYLNISRFSTSALLALVFLFLPESALWLVLLIGASSALGLKYIKRSDHLLH